MQLEELSVTSEDSETPWPRLVGLESLPKALARLRRLRKLELRRQWLLVSLPLFLPDLPITHLDVSFCKQLDLSSLSAFTSLQVLALQVGGRVLPADSKNGSLVCHRDRHRAQGCPSMSQ